MREENYIYHQDYWSEHKAAYPKKLLEKSDKICDMMKTAGVLKSVTENFKSLPKAVDSEKKKKFETLLALLDHFAKTHNGKINGVICPHDAEARITVELPFFELENMQELSLLRELANLSDYVSISPIEDGWVSILVMIKYFKILASPDEIEVLIEEEFEKFPLLLEELEKWQEIRYKNLYTTFLGLQALSDVLRAIQKKEGIDPQILFQRFVEELEKNPEGQEKFISTLCKTYDIAIPSNKYNNTSK